MDWHLLPVKEVFEKLDSSEKGLNNEQVIEKSRKYGENKLKKTRHFDALKVFFDQFKSFLIIILILAAIVSFFLESKVDAIVILAIVFVNAGIGFFQEYKAEKAIESLKKLMVPRSKVLRNNKVIEINSEQIVPGDILRLEEGDKIMADARVIESNGLKVSEAPLTGESFPEEKTHEPLKKKVPLADRTNMVYQGTQVISGTAKALVIDIGMATELGKISELVQEIKPEKNPLKNRLDTFAKRIGIFTIILSVLIVFLLIFTGSDMFQSFLVAVSLAVSAIPEGLPAVISLALAFATRRMIKRNVLVRKLPASETLGRVTIICTDKTGTLTEEKMRVTNIYTNGKDNPAKEKELLLKTGVLCNKARHETEKDKEYYIGDPTEVALIVSAKENFLDQKELKKQEPKIKEFPFNSERKMMSIVRDSKRKKISYVKGAPEKIIARSKFELINGRRIKLEEKDKVRLNKIYAKMAGQGQRVLGFAYKEIPYYLDNEKITQEMSENELVFVGFQGMIDPPRPEVKNAIKQCNEAGIKVLMITGDSKLTAEAVAREIGLTGESIDSTDFVKMSDKELFNRIDKVSVFSRISPKDKLRIIDILKKKNEIVAMTGDGVNDALALKRADIGISMGVRGTDVARDSSDIVLVDDNFASIVEGVKEGRTVYDNIKKFIKFLLSANFSQVILVILVMLIWRNPELLPLLPLQILWINLVTDSLPALALGAEPMERDVMKRKPSKHEILGSIRNFVIVAGLITVGISFFFFYFYIEDIDLARTMAVTSGITFEMFLVFNCKSHKSVFKSPPNKYLFYAVIASVGLQFIALYTPLNQIFSFVPLGIAEWAYILIFSVLGFLLIEGFKYWKKI